MKTLSDMIWIELRKVLRSRVPLFTALGFLMMPLIGALLIFIYKDPQLARQLGLLGTKANLVVGSADWPGYLNLMIEFTALGGFFFFCLAISWNSAGIHRWHPERPAGRAGAALRNHPGKIHRCRLSGALP